MVKHVLYQTLGNYILQKWRGVEKLICTYARVRVSQNVRSAMGDWVRKYEFYCVHNIRMGFKYISPTLQITFNTIQSQARTLKQQPDN